MQYKSINGIRVYGAVSKNQLVEKAFDEKSILIAINAEKILNAPEALVELINENIGYPDGVGAVWALHKKGINKAMKIPGCELWLDIIRNYQDSKKFYFVGGTGKVINEVIKKLEIDFPEIQISGFRNGYINAKEQNELIEDIKFKKPDIVFVAMGSPKQEFLMQKMHKINPALYMGLGGSFDVYTGNVKRAPKWWIKNNLEWAYRLVKQPTRIKRQVVYLKFYLLLKLNRL